VFSVSKAIGLTLTITGLMLAVWFVTLMLQFNWMPPVEYFIVAAMAVAMISVGVRYILKSPKKKSKPEPTKEP
jgi:membrane protein implicated in regulation of membrane protease activity